MADTLTNQTTDPALLNEYNKKIRELVDNNRAYGSFRLDVQNTLELAYQRGLDGTEPSKTDGFRDAAIASSLSPYNFKMDRSCRTYREVLMQMYGVGKYKTDDPEHKQLEKDGQLNPEEMITFFTGEGKDAGQLGAEDTNFCRFSVEDTSLGGNAAINSRWGFNRDDDIIQPLHALHGNPVQGGLGRVYFENYQVTQQLLHITLGVPEFQALFNFYKNCVDGNLANDVNSGESTNIARMFGAIAGGAAKLIIKLPFAIPLMADWCADLLDPTSRITRYYELRPAMPMYYRFVNSLFAHVSVLMGMTPNAIMLPDSWFPKAGTGGSQSSKSVGQALNILQKYSMNWDQNSDKYESSMPMFMSKTGPDVWKIISKQDDRLGLASRDPEAIEKYLARTDPNSKMDGGFFDPFSNRLKCTAQGADKFISFRINKNTDSTETLSNTTGQSSVASFINGIASKGQDARFSAGGSLNKLTNVITHLPLGIGKIFQGIGDVVSGAVHQIAFVDTAATVMTGSGFVDIPEIWTGSNFSKNYSFSFTFRPASGSNDVILQDEYLPLCMFLAMGCPRTVGQNAYSSPFLLRAYCKGMFAVPLGIVESMTITRGASEFGWNLARLPTVITISMTIKDLSPVMHMAMADSAAGMAIFGANTPMQEYMHTLAGSGLNERILFSSSFARRMALGGHLIRTTWRNPVFHATMLGNTWLGRIPGAFSSVSLYH